MKLKILGYGRDYFESGKYGYIAEKTDKIWINRLNDIAKRGYTNGRLLDIGCGYGYFLNICESHFEIYGIEISNYAIKHARKQLKSNNIILTDIQEGLPFRDDFFDVITMFDVLEHIKKYKRVLIEIFRTLKQGGLLVITTPNQWSLDCRLFGQNYWFNRDETHITIFNPISLESALKEIGFEEIEMKTTQLLHFLATSPLIFKRRTKSQAKHSRLYLLNQLKNVYRVLSNTIPSSQYGAIIYSFAIKPKS